MAPGIRKALSPKTRFDVFKRDGFTCRYCGRKTPQVILEVDHIVAVVEGGTNDLANLATSCWECNRGKRDGSLDEAPPPDSDMHELVVSMAEREMQLREYNEMKGRVRKREESDLAALQEYWSEAFGHERYPKAIYANVLRGALRKHAREDLIGFMSIAIERTKSSLDAGRYFGGMLRKVNEAQEASRVPPAPDWEALRATWDALPEVSRRLIDARLGARLSIEDAVALLSTEYQIQISADELRGVERGDIVLKEHQNEVLACIEYACGDDEARMRVETASQRECRWELGSRRRYYGMSLEECSEILFYQPSFISLAELGFEYVSAEDWRDWIARCFYGREAPIAGGSK